MNIEFYISCILIMIVFFLGVAIVTFVDIISLIEKMVPIKNSKEDELEKRIMQSDEYKSHRKKWWKRFMIPVIPFAIILAPAMLLFDDMIAFFIASVVSAIIFEMMSKKEKNERQEIEKCIKLRERNNKVI